MTATTHHTVDIAKAGSNPQSAEAQETILRVTDLRKDFLTKGRKTDDVKVLDGVSFDVSAGEFFTLLGPSGCGKTTTLRCVAGLETPTAGDIVLDGRTFYSSEQRINVPANRRGLGMVFQSYAIWPHMDVAANVAFPLRAMKRRARPSETEINRRVDAALEKVELLHLKKRRATALSGGQQQRLALARALVMEAPLTLFDEPLSNLDAKLRDGMRFELKRLQRELGLTSIYVTHDQGEALAMSTRIAIIKDGRIEQLARPRDIYENPISLFVADFVGTSNFLNGEVTEQAPMGGYLVATDAGAVQVTVDSARPLEVGTKVTLSLRPQHISIVQEQAVESGVGAWPGIVRTRAYLGEYVDHVVQVADRELRVRVDPLTSVPPGTEITLRVDAAACAVLPGE